jgi:hypothetical protein
MKWNNRPSSWADFLMAMWAHLNDALQIGKEVITKWISLLRVCILRLLSALRHEAELSTNDPGSAGDLELQVSSKLDGGLEQLALLTVLDLDRLDVISESVETRTVRWLLETSTDIDTIAAAAGLVPEVDWPEDYNVTDMVDRMESQLNACFDSTTGQLRPLAQAGAVACLKALYHFYVKRNLDAPFVIGGGSIIYYDGHNFYQIHGDEGFLNFLCRG